LAVTKSQPWLSLLVFPAIFPIHTRLHSDHLRDIDIYLSTS
jgi:hypothetical protein